MRKDPPKRLAPKPGRGVLPKRLAAGPGKFNIFKQTARRAVALTLCASMALSLVLLVMPIWGSAVPDDLHNPKDLYIREADENTMDSYVQASLGGYIYTQRVRKAGDTVDAVTTPTIRNNFGSRYAGEVWTDKSVFARYQPYIAEIKPFEAGHVYDNSTDEEDWVSTVTGKMSEVDRAINTLEYALGESVNYASLGFPGNDNQTGREQLKSVLTAGTLTAAQAKVLNKAVNDKMREKYAAAGNYGFKGDGDFDGGNLILKPETDGVDAVISLDGTEADFLHVFSALVSNEIVNNSLAAPLDVVFVLDASGSMCDAGDHFTTAGTENFDDGKGHKNGNSRLEFAADALNNAFDTLMSANNFNRVALVTYNDGLQEVMSLGRYQATKVDRAKTQSNGYRNYNENDSDNSKARYFTVAKDGWARPTYINNVPVAFDETNNSIIYIGTVPFEIKQDNDGKWRARDEAGTVVYETDTPYIQTVYMENGTAKIVNAVITIGDNRFTSVNSYNQTTNADGSNVWNGKGYQTSTETEWNMIEINAQPAGGSLGGKFGEDADHVSYNNSDLYYIKTGLQTDTQISLLYGMQQILGKATGTTLYYDEDGNLTENREEGVGEPVRRRPIMILLTDGRAQGNIVHNYDYWWDSDTALERNGTGYNYGNIPLYIAATAALWKKVVNTNYYGTPDPDDDKAELYTFGICLDDDVEMNPVSWTDPAYDEKGAEGDDEGTIAKKKAANKAAYDAASAYIDNAKTHTGYLDLNALGALEAFYKRYMNSQNDTKLVNQLATILKTDNNWEASVQELIDNPVFPTDETKTDNKRVARLLADLLMSRLASFEHIGTDIVGPLESLQKSESDRVEKLLVSLIKGYPDNRASFMGSGDNQEFREPLDALLKGLLGISDVNEIKNINDSTLNTLASLLVSVPSGTLTLGNGKLDLNNGGFTSANLADQYENGLFGTEAYKPQKVSDFNYTDRFEDVTDPKNLTNVFDRLLTDLIDGDIFSVVGGKNAAGVQDALTLVDPIGDYMSVDDVTDLVLFGVRYRVEKHAVYDYTVNQEILKDKEHIEEGDRIKNGWYQVTDAVDEDGNRIYNYEKTLPEGQQWQEGWVYRTSYQYAQKKIPTLTETDSNEELTDKQKNTTYTGYHIVSEYAIDENGNVIEKAVEEGSGADRENLSYKGLAEKDAREFNLLDDITIWVEDSGDFRDTDGSGFIADNAYSEALHINIDTDALPTQIAMITMESDPESPTRTRPKEYSTNLSKTEASTPLRVFYNVSFDKDYLRYMAESEENQNKQDKSQAVGVALSKIDSEYLEKNTGYYGINTADGFYDKTEEAEISEPENGETPGIVDIGRYVAFYSNYFSNSEYNEYPVVTDNTKGSRGDPVVTFSPQDGNHFYRFQKNRVLFLIPGAETGDKRPAELNLGNLEEKFALEAEKLGVKTKGLDAEIKALENEVGAALDEKLEGTDKPELTENEQRLFDLRALKAMDPTTPEGLLNILNQARVDAESTYSAYDCVAVTGGPYDAPVKREDGNGIQSSNNGTIHYDEQISSNNWYYIIREFYYPTFSGDNKTTTENVSVRYMAIARKGSEFGSGLSRGGSMGSEVEWYYPGSDIPDETVNGAKTSPFKNDKASFYGRPGGDQYDNGWYASAMPGGLRVGGLANFAGVKGYEIREGVGEGSFSKAPEVIDRSNVTDTALTYFLPTIGDSSNLYSTDPQISTLAATKIVVNTYLGNNGRILVPNTTLLVTKTVTTDDEDGDSDTPSAKAASTPGEKLLEEFTFIVEIEGLFGSRGAVVVIRDEFDRSQWRQRFQSIDVLAENRNLLLGNDDKLVVVDDEGRRIVQDKNGVWYYYTDVDLGKPDEVTKISHYVPRANSNPYDVKDGTEPRFYVYAGDNVTKSYGDKLVRVFEADPKGDLYNNAAVRGGRTFFAKTKEDAERLEKEHTGPEHSDSTIFTAAKEEDTKRFAGDREYWLDRVCLIPVDEVTKEGNDWTWGLDETLQDIDENEVKNKHPGSILITSERERAGGQFVIAALRAVDKTGNTSDTTLISDEGYALRASYKTEQVVFKKPTANSSYGRAEITLKDGEGLLFNNIRTGAWYDVTEQLTEAQVVGGVEFLQVDHVQAAKLRTRYQYSRSSPLLKEDGSGLVDFVRNKEITGSPDAHGTDSEGYTPHQPDPKYVYVERSYEAVKGTGGDTGGGTEEPLDDRDPPPSGPDGYTYHYYWWQGKEWGNTPVKDGYYLENTANFTVKPISSADSPRFTDDHNYLVAGNTSAFESAVHYVNIKPIIEKLEYVPGNERLVEVGDEITYGIRWENNAVYNSVTGEWESAKVIIRDRLDDGVQFVKATFNPYHGNMYDRTATDTLEEIKFDKDDFLKEYKKKVSMDTQKVPPSWLNSDETNYGPKNNLDLIGNNSGDPVRDMFDLALVLEGIPEGSTAAKSIAPKTLTDDPEDSGPDTGGSGTGGSDAENPVIGDKKDTIKVTIRYTGREDTSEDDLLNTPHTVYWEIEDAPGNTYGYVELTVKVIDDAVKDWRYYDGDDPDTDLLKPAEHGNRPILDQMVYNRAAVKVDMEGQSWSFTTIVENPLEPLLTPPDTGGFNAVIFLCAGVLLISGLVLLRPRGRGRDPNGENRRTGPPASALGPGDS